MDYALTNAGLNEAADAFANRVIEVAVGTGTTAVTKSDTALQSEVYRAATDTDAVSVTVISGRGALRVSIIIVGGTSVPSETDIFELGLFNDAGELLYRQVTDTPLQTAAGQSLQIDSELEFAPLVRN